MLGEGFPLRTALIGPQGRANVESREKRQGVSWVSSRVQAYTRGVFPELSEVRKQPDDVSKVETVKVTAAKCRGGPGRNLAERLRVSDPVLTASHGFVLHIFPEVCLGPGSVLGTPVTVTNRGGISFTPQTCARHGSLTYKGKLRLAFQ